MSGSKNDEDIERAYSLGATSYLVKPTRFEEMVKMMETLKDYTTWRKTGKGAASSINPPRSRSIRAAAI
jgi:hypothetical protein